MRLGTGTDGINCVFQVTWWLIIQLMVQAEVRAGLGKSTVGQKMQKNSYRIPPTRPVVTLRVQ